MANQLIVNTVLVLSMVWGTQSAPSQQTVFGYQQSSGTAISVVQVNGKTQITLDGVQVDLTKAKILREDDSNVVLSPVEVEGAVITVSKKENGTIKLDYKGQHFETLRPENIQKSINANLAHMEKQMEEMRQQLQKMQEKLFSQFQIPLFH